MKFSCLVCTACCPEKNYIKANVHVVVFLEKALIQQTQVLVAFDQIRKKKVNLDACIVFMRAANLLE